MHHFWLHLSKRIKLYIRLSCLQSCLFEWTIGRFFAPEKGMTGTWLFSCPISLTAPQPPATTQHGLIARCPTTIDIFSKPQKRYWTVVHSNHTSPSPPNPLQNGQNSRENAQADCQEEGRFHRRPARAQSERQAPSLRPAPRRETRQDCPGKGQARPASSSVPFHLRRCRHLTEKTVKRVSHFRDAVKDGGYKALSLEEVHAKINE